MTLRYNPGDAVQRGLPGVAAEEEALPSERVLSGELLGERRREALAGLRAALGDRPDGFLPEEWAVVVAVLSPPTVTPGHHLGGQKARSALTVRARDCFPGFPVHAALRAFREVQTRPHVAEVIADFRALEAVDVLEQRTMYREAIATFITAAVKNIDGLYELDATAAAKVTASAASVMKIGMDLDGLKASPTRALSPGADDADAPKNGKDTIDAFASLAAKVAIVATDSEGRTPLE